MDEETLLRRKIFDTANKSYNQNIYTYTGFLGLSELAIYNSMKKELQFAYPSTFGGSESSERQIIRFGSPEIFGYDDSFPISILKIAPLTPKFAQELEHRDYLGAIMNLSIERSLIGDILIKEKDAYVYCMNHIAEFITDNLITVKHNHVRATVCDEIPDIIPLYIVLSIISEYLESAPNLSIRSANIASDIAAQVSA